MTSSSPSERGLNAVKAFAELGVSLQRHYSAGFIVSLELVLILTILILGSLVGVIAIRNALYQLRAARAQFDIIVNDSTAAPDGPFRFKPVSYDLCEAPEIQCRDEGFDAGNLATPGPSEGLNALVGIRADRFVSRNQIYFTGPGCTGAAYIAPPAVGAFADPAVPIGYFNCAVQIDANGDRVCYGVGPPVSWPCTLGVDCADAGTLYRNNGLVTETPPITSRWVSLNPDCALELPDSILGTTDICDDTFDTMATELLPAIQVTTMAGTNLLAQFTPLFNIMPATQTEVQFYDTDPLGDPWSENSPVIDPDNPPPGGTTDPGTPISNPPGAAPGAFPAAGPEDAPSPP